MASFTLLDLCESSLRRGHANLLCIVPILTDDPRRESKKGMASFACRHPRNAEQRKQLHARNHESDTNIFTLITPECLKASPLLVFVAAGSAKRRMDSSSGRSKVGVSSKMRIAHQARQRTGARHAATLLWP